MKYLVVTILLISLSLTGYPQEKIQLYIDANNMKTDSANALYIKEVSVASGIYKVTDMDMDHKMLNYCEFSSINPPIENGLAIHYKDPDVIYSKGHYLNGVLSGKWYYYSENGTIDTVDYTNSSAYNKDEDCVITDFAKKDNKNAMLEEILKSSVDAYLHDNYNLPARTRAQNEYFDLDINYTFDTEGNIGCIEFTNSSDNDLEAEVIRLLKKFKYQGKIKMPLKISYTFSNEEDVYVIPNKEELYVIVEDMPKFRGGDLNTFRSYIEQHLNYPEIAQKNGIQGRVFIQFAVNSKGEVVDVKVVRGVDPSLDAEAVRVVKNSPKWTPGRQRGKPVKVQFTFPIIFILN